MLSHSYISWLSLSTRIVTCFYSVHTERTARHVDADQSRRATSLSAASKRHVAEANVSVRNPTRLWQIVPASARDESADIQGDEAISDISR